MQPVSSSTTQADGSQFHSPPQRLTAEHWPALQDLLQAVHRRETLQSYPAEYPLMLGPQSLGPQSLSPQSLGTSVGIVAPSGELLAHVGILPRWLTWNHWRLKVALIGSVATRPGYEGQGLAGQTLIAAHKHIQSEGMTVAFLWSETRSLYARLGYHSVGRALLFRLHPSSEREVPMRPPITPLSALDIPAILALHRPHFATFERSPEETMTLLGIPHVQLWGITHQGKLQAALAIGKGTDMPDICHEFWGDEALILPMLKAVQLKTGRTLGLLVPDLPSPLLRQALGQGLFSIELPEAQGIVLDEAGLYASLSGVLPAKSYQTLGTALGQWEAGESLLTAVLGPKGGRSWEGLPLPFHVWGLDSN